MSFPDITVLIPHRGRSVLLDRVVEFGSDRVLCTAEIRPGHAYETHDGSVPAAVALEMMAQAAAAFLGLCRTEAGAQRAGYVIAVRQLRLEESAFGAGTVLHVGAAPTTGSPGTAAGFDCWVERDALRVAEATLIVYQPEFPGASSA